MLNRTVRFLKLSFWSHTWRMISINQKRIFIAVILFHFALSLLYIRYQGLNPDEYAYFGYAVHWAQGNPSRIEVTDDSKSPLVFPALLPIIIKPFYQQPNDPHGFFFLKLGRICMYVYQAAGAFILFLFLFRMAPKTKYWLPPLLLYLLDPTIFSFGMMVGTDVASAFVLLLSCYSAWRYILTRESRYWYWLTVGCGLGFVVKASMVFILPVLMMAMILSAWWYKWFITPGYYMTSLKRWLQLLISIWLIINVAYYFKGSFQPVSEMPEKSQAFQQLKQQLSFAAKWPVPLPYDYMTGFDMLMHNAEKGGGLGEENSYIGIVILGKYFERGPVWYYYIVSLLFKTPLIVFILLITAAAVFFANRHKWVLLKKYFMLWFPALFFFVLMSLNNPFQIGIRHAIIVMPFMYLAAAYGLHWWIDKHKKVLMGMFVLQGISLALYWPNMIAYTNELLFPKKKVYKYFYDSSISYRTERPFLQHYLIAHPDYSLPPTSPKAGKYAIDIERYAQPLQDSTYNLHWMYDNFEPVGTYRHNILLFEITEKDLQGKGLK